MERRYPLESLQRLRRDQVDRCLSKLARQRARAQAAAELRRRAEGNRVAEQAQAAKVRATEQLLLQGGEARACDLEQAARWQRAAQARSRELFEAEIRARSKECSEMRAEEHARTELSQLEAQSTAVERHRERWDAEQARVLERAEEDQAWDGWTARRLLGQETGSRERE